MQTEKRKNDMTEGKPLKLILAFSIPLLLGNVLQQMYNLVDTIVVGNFAPNPEDCIAAVGISMPIMFLMTSFFLGIGQGATIIISQFFGARDEKAIKKAVDTIYIFLFVVSVPLSIIGVIASGPILELINTTKGNIFDNASIYLIVMCIGILPSFGFNINSGIMQGIGNSKISLLFLGIATAVNIILDLLFVAVFGWGVFGVAVATVIAQAVSFVVGIIYINKKDYGFKISIKNLSFDWSILKNIAKLGLPGGIQNALFSVGMITLTSLINTITETYPRFSAAFTIAQKVDSFAFLPIVSFSVAITAYVGQNIGAGKLDRVKKGVRTTIILSAIASVAICAVVLPLSEPLIRLFSQDPDVIDFAQGYLFRMLPFMSILAAHFIIGNALRGAGQSIIPLFASMIGLWGARLPAAYILAHFFPDNPANIFFSFVFGWILGLLPVSIYYYGGWWKKRAFQFVKPGSDADTV